MDGETSEQMHNARPMAINQPHNNYMYMTYKLNRNERLVAT